MSYQNTTNALIDTFICTICLVPPPVKFWLYLTFLVPSIICTLYVLYYLLFDRTLRRALNNHVIIVLLITVFFSETTIYPWMLYYFYHSSTWERSDIFCTIWGYMDLASYNLQIALFAWASVERHILIFHDVWVATKKKRFYVHYLPIIIITIYYLVFYFIMFFFPFCTNTISSVDMICISLCLYGSVGFRIFETLTNGIIPNFTIVIFSIALLIRVIRQKQRMHQAIHWRKHRKMTIQLLSISLLYLVFTIPNSFIVFLRICGLPDDKGANFQDWTLFFTYYIVLVFPFVAVFSVPEILAKTKTIFQLHRRARLIAPEILAMRNIRRN